MKKDVFFCLAAMPGLLFAEGAESLPAWPAAVTNETVVVTAAALPRYRVEANDSGTLVPIEPEKAPFVVDTFTEDFIRERNATDLDQLMSMQPGVYQGGKTVMARQAGTYSIRGYSGSEVMLGGVPLVGGIGTFFDPTLLERVDIVKGPIGGAYGSQSAGTGMSDLMGAGGSIHLQTKQPRFDGDFYDFLTRASYSKASGWRAKFAADVNKALVEEAFAVRAPAAWEWRDPGWAPKGARQGRTFSAAPSMTFRLADRLEAGLDLFYQYSDQPAYQGIRMLYGKPYGTGWDDTFTRPEDRMKFQVHGGTFRLDGKVAEWLTLRTRASMFQTANRYSYRGPYSNMGFNPLVPAKTYEYAAGDRLLRNWYAGQDAIFNFETFGVEHKLLFGVNGTLKQTQGWGWFGTPSTDSTKQACTKLGLTVQELAQWKGFSFLAGARADFHSSVKHVHEQTLSPRAGLSYDIAEAGVAILFANLSLTDTPNFNYKRWPGNTGTAKSDYLDTKWRAVQKEAGLRVSPLEKLWLTGTVFRIDQTNAPIAMTDPGTGLAYYSSDGKTYSQGVEFSASGDLTDNWSLYLAYAYIDYCDKTNGRRFDRFPPHAVSLWTSYKAEWLYDAVFGFGGRWRDAWMMTFRGNPAGEDQAVRRLITFDASVDFPLSENLSLGFALRNIFDMRGVESARNLQAFANDGRTFELSLHCRF